jgi:hypothetical protein
MIQGDLKPLRRKLLYCKPLEAARQASLNCLELTLLAERHQLVN